MVHRAGRIVRVDEMDRAHGLAPIVLAIACHADASSMTAAWQPDDEAGSTAIVGESSSDGTSSSSGSLADTSSSSSGDAPEIPPAPADGDGISDPPSRSLHNACGGVDWQRIHGWLLQPHAEPEIGPADELARCVERYAGWVTHEADAAEVSRASVYAALAATGQCDDDRDYDGALLSAAQCVLVHPELDENACLAAMADTRAFGIATLAQAIAAAVDEHDSDPPRMAAWLGHGAIECGGDDRWRMLAPAGFVDRYTAAYNAYKAQDAMPPSCKKRIVVSVALYTGMDDPGVDGVAAANGCWTFERITKQNAEWKICNYDGTVHHEDGFKWAYDDTNTSHSAATDVARIEACRDGVPGRGYVYMTNRGSGWPKRVTEGVDVHFAEIYSGQYAIDDQFSLWKQDGKPGEPMINLGEPVTDASEITAATKRACDEVGDGGWLGVYVYPESLRGDRMSALVNALDHCTDG